MSGSTRRRRPHTAVSVTMGWSEKHVTQRDSKHADTIVVGGGTAGAALAGILAERTDQSVLLLEAGPDYGPYDGGGWPSDLLEAFDLAESHGWGYDSGDSLPGPHDAVRSGRA